MPAPVKNPGAPQRSDAKSERRRVKMPGTDSLVDVARKVFKDARVAPLLADLNPGVPLAEPLAAGVVVTLPSLEEVQRFASRMGFQLGFDPAAGGSTKAKRAWNRMQEGAKAAPRAIDPVQLASTLVGQELDAEEAAKRVLALVVGPDLDAFCQGPHGDEKIASVAAACERLLLRRKVREGMQALIDVLEGTTTPAGKRRLFDALAGDPEDAAEVLSALLVSPALREALASRAPRIAALVAEAERVAREDPHVREAKLNAADDGDREALAALVAASVDKVPLLDGPRVQLLDAARELAALDQHAKQIAETLGRLLDSLERAPLDVLRAVARGGGAELPRPWPVVAALLGRLGGLVGKVHAGKRALGVGELVRTRKDPTPSEGAGPSMSAAELAARAAVSARIADEHEGVPERLAATVVALFDPLRPAPPDRGPEAQVRERRKARFEKAILGPRGAVGDPAVIRSLTEELFGLARRCDDAELRRRAERLSPGARNGALELAPRVAEPLQVLVRGASDVGRALLLVALALDPEQGPTLARESGREAAVAFLRRHGGRALSLATKAYTGPQNTTAPPP